MGMGHLDYLHQTSSETIKYEGIGCDTSLAYGEGILAC